MAFFVVYSVARVFYRFSDNRIYCFSVLPYKVSGSHRNLLWYITGILPEYYRNITGRAEFSFRLFASLVESDS